MKITGAQAIINSLEIEKVNLIFGYPGAAISPFYDALLDSEIKHVLTRHEQGAVHAASGYARVTGEVGVCVATSGPGATNLITGIATAYMDSIPIVAISGQVSSELIGKDVFQEVDITGATEPFCKHSYLVKNVKDLPRIIKEAFHIAITGRPGPVLIDIPVDIQNQEIEFVYPEKVDIKGYKPTYKGNSKQIKKMAEAIAKSKKPVICAGGGIINSNASEEIIKLIEKCNIPVATTLMGIGSIPTKHKLNLGMVGMHGTYKANYAVNHADLVLIIGTRVADRAMGAASKIADRATVIHIDIDPAEIGKNLETSIPVVGDVKTVLKELNQIIESGDTTEWVETINSKKKSVELGMQDECSLNCVRPKEVLKILSQMVDDDTIITTEVGQNQIWAANYFEVKKPRTFISSGGMGTMGYGLPAAVGAKMGAGDRKVIAISGDGSFQMSLQELGTIKQEKLGVKMLLFNNSRLGMVRELQKLRHNGRYSAVFLEDNPDFGQLVKAYGFKSKIINSNTQIKEAIAQMLSDDAPFLLECIVDCEEPTL